MKQAAEDVDIIVVIEAIQFRQQSERYIIFGKAIDILLLLTEFAHNSPAICFLEPEK